MCRRCSLFILGLIVGLAGTASAAEPAALSLAVQVQPDGTVLLTGTVTDAKRTPVPGARVTFQVKTTFGWLIVGDVTTDRAGEARVVLPQLPRSGEIAAEAEAGAKTLHAAKVIERAPPPATQTRPGYDALSDLSAQPGFISPYPVPLEVMLLVVVLGGVWITYAYLVSMLVKIRRAPQGWPESASLRSR